MKVEAVNNWLYWTWYGSYDEPVLVATEDAPPEQVQFAKGFEALGTHRVIFEDPRKEGKNEDN